MIIATGDLSARFDQWVQQKGHLTRAAAETQTTPHLRPHLATSYVAPTTEVESRLATLGALPQRHPLLCAACAADGHRRVSARRQTGLQVS